MKINYDWLADSMYIAYQNKKVAFSRENWDWAVFDFDEFWWLVWIELIWVKRLFSKKQIKDSNLMIS
jgi:uncharacterized protein YuzE